MTDQNVVKEPELERQGRRLGRSGERWLLVALLIAAPGILLVVLTGGFVQGLGIAILAIAGGPAIIGVALLLASLVSRWSARHKSFA